MAYNLCQRNHTYEIDQKLVENLHLIRADLVINDSLVGSEGNCSALVEPAQSRSSWASTTAWKPTGSPRA